MAKNADALIFSIGVDTEQLYQDLSEATKSLEENVKQINNRLKQNKLRIETQIETAQLNKDYDTANKLIAQKREHELASYKAALNEYKNALANLSQEELKNDTLVDSLLKKITEYTKKVEKSQKSVDSFKKAHSFAGAMGVMKNSVIDALQSIDPAAATAMRSIDAMIASTSKRVDSLKNKLTSTTGVRTLGVATIFGAGYAATSYLDSIEEKAKSAATNLEATTRQAQALGLSFKDFSSLKTLSGLSGVDIQPAIDRVSQLNKALSTAGENGNKTSKILEKWGISLRNDDGTYKSFTEQLKVIADGYQQAEKDGTSYAYTVEVLGSGLAEIIPLLKDFNKYQSEASELVKTGFADPELAKKLADAMRFYEMQKKQNTSLGGYLGADGALEYYQKMIEVEQTWARFHKENKEAMQSLTRFLVDIQKNFTGLLQQIELIIAKATQSSLGRIATTTLGAAAAGGAGGAIFGPHAAAAGAVTFGAVGLAESVYNEFFSDQSKSLEKINEATKSATDSEEKRTQAAEATAEALRKQEEVAEKIEKLNADINEKIYSLTHSSEENELHSLENERSKYLKNGADEDTVDEYYYLQRAKIEQKYTEQAEEARKQAEEKAKAEREKALKEQEDALKKQEEEQKKIAEEAKKQAEERANAEKSIADVFASEHEKRLQQIETQRQAWIKAGADELRATEAAEEQKRRARESEAERYLRDRADLIKRASKLESAGLSQQEIMQNLEQYQTKKQYKDLGLNESQINVASKYYQMLDNLASVVKSSVLAPVSNKIANNNSNITVNIDRPVVRNSSDMSELAEEVAGRINDAIKFGGLTNGY